MAAILLIIFFALASPPGIKKRIITLLGSGEKTGLSLLIVIAMAGIVFDKMYGYIYNDYKL